jgi:hypothetical protein
MIRVFGKALKIVGIILAGIIVILLAGIIWFFSSDSGCDNEIYKNYFSPDGSHKVVLYSRNCGATTGFSTHISILKSEETIEGSGNAFTADDDHGKARRHPKFGSLIDVRIRWVSNSLVEIGYDTNSRVFTKDDKIEDVDIIYSK